MNKQFLRHIAFAVLLSLPVIGGCKPAESSPVPPPATNATPAIPPATNAAAAEPVQPEVPFAVERPIPTHLNATSALKEVVKLAQAGVDEAVLLSFVDNSTTSFLLGADEIIYLTDIGVPATVINSMMERDKTLKAVASVVGSVPAASETATQVVAVAPTYETEPESVAAEPAEAAVSETDFVDALSPYGTWIDVEGYGRCWQPTVVVVNPSWRPYCDGGRWVYTDSGWYWYSDYSWGWAPFHYGRWFSHPRWGWCWAPDYTWGPAWVTWSYTDTYCGWAPLPPAAVYTGAGFTYYGSSCSVSFGFGLSYAYYSYVPWRNFCDYKPWRYCAPRPHCKEIYDRATCHNDYGSDRNRRVVNRGLPPERVASYSRTEVRRVNVREVADLPSRGVRREEITRDGRTLEIRRPAPTRAVAANGSRTVGARNLAGNESSPGTSVANLRDGQRERPSGLPVVKPGPETAGRGAVGRAPATSRHNAGETTPAIANHSARPGEGQPLVVVGNGDGRPATPSTWNPYEHERQQLQHREAALAAVTPEVESAPAHPATPAVESWTQPTRPGGGAPQPSQVIRVGRGIEDRSGGPNYRVYSSPQRQAPSAPSYGLPPTVNNPTPSRPANTPSARSDDDGGGRSNYEPSRPPAYESPRQTERSPQPNNPPARPAPSESRSVRAESRPAPEQRSAPARSESSRSESRPDPSDSSRSSRPR